MYDNNQRPRSCAFALAGGLIVMLMAAGIEAAGATGGPVDRVAVVSQTNGEVFIPGNLNPAPNVFADLPGAVINLTVPPGTSRLFVATYSAESACFGGLGDQYCGVRILIGGAEGHPASNVDFAFDSTNSGADNENSWESHSMQRWRRIANPGSTALNVQIKVQRMTTSWTTSLRLDDWQLTVLRSE